MALRRTLVLGCTLAALLAPATARADSTMFFGAGENAPLVPDAATAKAKVDLAKLAGFDTLRVSMFWGRGRASIIPTDDLLRVQNAALAAQLAGMRLLVSVSNFNSRDTPNTQRYRDEFSIYTLALARALPSVTDFIIGNEPNLNLFWMPQFSKPVYGTKLVNGKRVRFLKKPAADLAAPAYEKLLAQTYDLLKSFNPDINVIGVALSPRGGDDPTSTRQTHSPETFLLDLGKAYRASHRKTPIMDAFGIHPYLEKSSLPPTFAHPRSKNIGIADYAKLTQTLGKAFGGTAQPGSTLPIVYDEFGVQSVVPSRKQNVYTNLGAPLARDAVSEAVQAKYYTQALTMAYCQPNVVGMLLFHVSDEANAAAWQSGLYYADDTPKSSLGAVRAAAEAARAGKLSSCAGATKGAFLESVTLPTKDTFTADNTSWGGDLTCTAWCTYAAKIEKFPSGETAPELQIQADAQPNTFTPVVFRQQKLAPGTYRIAVRVWALGKIGTAIVRYGTPFEVTPPPPPPTGG